MIFDIFHLPPATGKRTKKCKSVQMLAETFMNDRSERNFYMLMKPCKWGLYTYINNMVKDDYATDDIMSRTMENVYFGIDKFDSSKGKFITWMYIIARNIAIDYIRELKKRYSLTVSYMDTSNMMPYKDENDEDENEAYVDSPDIDNIFFDGMKYVTYYNGQVLSDMYDAAVECIDYLTPTYKTVMMERYINNKKMNDIAKDNNMPYTSVVNWIRKGKIQLGNELKERHPYLYQLYLENKNLQ